MDTPERKEQPKGDLAHRQGGEWRGQVHISDDFDAPLPEEIEAAFRGESEDPCCSASDDEGNLPY